MRLRRLTRILCRETIPRPRRQGTRRALIVSKLRRLLCAPHFLLDPLCLPHLTRVFSAETHVTETRTITERPLASESADNQAGQLVTAELARAREDCRRRVRELAAECRAGNRRFRDLDFDLEEDRQRCLHGCTRPDPPFKPSDVQRVTQIFDQPRFFSDAGPNSGDIIQSEALGNCWFLSALSTCAAMEGLVDRFCVERDEAVGIYGFIIFRDNAWMPVIIDDLLYTCIPKFEDLTAAEKALYHNDLETYNRSARKGGGTLYFARSGQQGETWVPLLEKAYAKLHGDYASLVAGWDGEAVEDLTGGVAGIVQIKDILDPDHFWTHELLRANKDRLFACSFADDANLAPNTALKSTGLLAFHSYSVLRAVEARGKRFLVLRNPWGGGGGVSGGSGGWAGPWSNGSREWTQEWLGILPVLKHSFGDDGRFVMEYKDFLEFFGRMDRTLLFDSRWVMASHWVFLTSTPSPWTSSYGDVSFTITIPAKTRAVIVLSRVNERYWMDLRGCYEWNIDFKLYKRGSKKCIGRSVHSSSWKKSVSLETELDEGEYVVHVSVHSLSY
ncbi:cysteine proteinase [Schizophyllum commune H4-8]|uniref:Calpain catalytic domain-containing protein n=1 Tax=Schizophyllum commune (strain H4-8 / FGSC 9210) TaxID=578458 RepID=D8Q2S1_SCHCM|nr:cysteine proteinase [Schizophyllum commune H4-8]KAI5894576.1 cysteine proteinase [Schizophyllum commune H4-8]